jgi:chitinase
MKRRILKLGALRSACITVMIVTSIVTNAQHKVVGYIPKGQPTSEVDFTKITHLMIAFENPDAAGNLSYTSGNDAFVTAAHNNGVKALISIGGGAASSDMTLQNRYTSLMSPTNRADFISKIVVYLNAHNLDGIDLDLEGPAINQYYNDFVPALKTALPVGKLLTAALSHTNNGDVVSPEAVQTFDFLGVMAYDRNWGQPLHHSTYDFAVTSANWWVTNKGMPPGKIILGVPFYGYTNTTGSGAISFENIINTYGTAAAQQDTWVSGGNTIYYNGIPTIRQKTQFVVDNAFGGIMMWQLAQDAAGTLSLLYNIVQVLNGGCALPAQPGVISGNTNVSAGSNNTYSIGAVSGATSYTWTLPFGWTGTSSTTSINTTAGSSGGTISVRANNACGAGASRTLTVSVAGSGSSLKIEAENYTSQKGVEIVSCSDVGGGSNVTSIGNRNYVEYTVNIPVAATYRIDFRVASTSLAKFEFRNSQGLLATISVPNTGGNQVWQTISHTQQLPAGIQKFRLLTTSSTYSLNWLLFESTSSGALVTNAKMLTEDHVSNEESRISVYPNPAHGSFTIETQDNRIIKEVIISSSAGINKTIRPATSSFTIYSNDFVKGLYVLKIRTEKHTEIKKIIIE